MSVLFPINLRREIMKQREADEWFILSSWYIYATLWHVPVGNGWISWTNRPVFQLAISNRRWLSRIVRCCLWQFSCLSSLPLGKIYGKVFLFRNSKVFFCARQPWLGVFDERLCHKKTRPFAHVWLSYVGKHKMNQTKSDPLCEGFCAKILACFMLGASPDSQRYPST